MTMHDRDGLIWHNGKVVPWREAQVHVLTHTLHYGMGVFEGVRAYETARGPAIFRLRDHTSACSTPRTSSACVSPMTARPSMRRNAWPCARTG